MKKTARKRALLWSTAAALVGGMALLQCCGGLRPLARLFGPKQVTLQENYADSGADPKLVFDHSVFDRVLGHRVAEGGWVDYVGLRDDAAELETYIASLAEAPFEALGRDEKLALLLNAYNAFTLQLILDHYPLDSIKDIPSSQRWDAVRWKLAGETYSLSQLEHDEIRPNFAEPRVHFALVCAAVGCPPLRSEAYSGEKLEAQLQDQTQQVHREKRWFVLDVEGRNVELTSLYDWYGSDFVQVAPSVLDYAARFSDELRILLEESRDIDVNWMSYDWSLNDRSPRDG